MKQTETFLRKAGRFVLIIFSFLGICVLVFIGVLLVWSPGTVEPFSDENGKELADSISEKIYVNINDVEQGMLIRGEDTSNPVLLFLHGGPGMPEYFLAEQYPAGLEECFTICWWEQRGAGLSYHSDNKAETITVEQLINDTLDLTNYLLEEQDRFLDYMLEDVLNSTVNLAD